jgi:hypothetical protein
MVKALVPKARIASAEASEMSGERTIWSIVLTASVTRSLSMLRTRS